MRSWADSADQALADVFRDLPRDTPEAEVAQRVKDAYPFGPREHHPYKVWLRRVKAWRLAWSIGVSGPWALRIIRQRHQPDQEALPL